MSLDELLKGLSVFKQGMQELAQTTALNDANQQVMQLNTLALDEKEKLAQINQVSQGLAARLMGTGGMSADQAATAVGIFGPSQGAQFAAVENRALQEDRQKFEAQQSALERANKLAVAGETAGVKQQEKLGKFVIKFQDKVKSLGIDKSVEAADKAYSAIKTLEAGNPISDSSIGAFLARAAGEVGNLSEYEQKLYKGSPALLDEMRRLSSLWSKGKLDAKNRAFIIKHAKTLAENGERSAEAKLNALTEQAMYAAKTSGYDFDRNELKTGLFDMNARLGIYKQKPKQEMSNTALSDEVVINGIKYQRDPKTNRYVKVNE